MARMVKKPRPAGEPYKRTVTWDPVSKRNYWLRIWLSVGGAVLIVIGAFIGKCAPSVSGVCIIAGAVIALGARFARALGLLPYTQPTVTHEGEYRSWVGRGFLIGLGVVFVLAMILFGVMASRYH